MEMSGYKYYNNCLGFELISSTQSAIEKQMAE